MKKKCIKFDFCHSLFYFSSYNIACTTLFHYLFINFSNMYYVNMSPGFLFKNEYIKHCANRNYMGVNNICCITFLSFQKSSSKFFMTSQQTFTCSKSTRETIKVDVVLMPSFLTLNIGRTILESLLLALNRKMLIWIASSDYETICIYADLFQTSVFAKYMDKL